MNSKKFSQKDVNRIVAIRVKREQERLTKEFETKMKRCMASIHLTLYQEMCSIKRDIAAETMEASLPPDGANKRQEKSRFSQKYNEANKGGEQL